MTNNIYDEELDEFEDNDVTDDSNSSLDSPKASFTKLTREERECFIWICEADGYWMAESSIPKYWRRFEKKGWKLVDTQYYPDGTVQSKTFKGSDKGIIISDPFKAKREMTEEQKEAQRERLKNMWKSRGTGI